MKEMICSFCKLRVRVHSLHEGDNVPVHFRGFRDVCPGSGKPPLPEETKEPEPPK